MKIEQEKPKFSPMHITLENEWDVIAFSNFFLFLKESYTDDNVNTTDEELEMVNKVSNILSKVVDKI